MGQQTLVLQDPLILGEGADATELKHVTLRGTTVGDYLDAVKDSERAVPTPKGYVLLTSDALVGANLLRRQIVSIDDHKGPLSLAELRKISQRDMRRLDIAATLLDEAAGGELESQGRGETA